MLIRRYRTALLRAALAVVLVGIVFACVTTLGRRPVSFDGFWIGVWLIIGFITSVIAAISGFALISLDERHLRLATRRGASTTARRPITRGIGH